MATEGNDLNKEASSSRETLTVSKEELEGLIESGARKLFERYQAGLPDEISLSEDLDEVENVCGNSQRDAVGESVSKISFKAPQALYRQEPKIWFFVMEKQFALAGIRSEETMFSHVVCSLDPRLLEEFSNIIMKDKGPKPYSVLKAELIKRLGESDKERLCKVLHGCVLGDKKPSTLFEEMQRLAGQSFSLKTLRQLWIERLPPHVRVALSTFEKFVSIEGLIARADSAMEAYSQPDFQLAVKSQASSSISQVDGDIFRKMVKEVKDELVAEVAAIVNNSRNSSQSNRQDFSHDKDRNRSRNRERSKSRSSSQGESFLCFYHRRFGDKASKCVTGCKRHDEFLKISKN